MKPFLIVLMLVASCTGAYTQACCYTGAATDYSILPNLNKHVVGLRYSYSNYFSEAHRMNHHEQHGTVSTDLHSLEIFGRFNLIEHLQLSVFIPVNFIGQSSMGVTDKTNSLGDMSLLLQYSLLNPLKCNGKKTKHQLRLGAGIKLPSGEFKMAETNMPMTSVQLGTGSVDFFTNAIYTFRLKNFGFNTSVAYKINTTNTMHYRFGDKLQVGTIFFYVFEVKEIQFMPSIGFNYEHQFENSNQKILLDYTGGDFLNAVVGFDVYYQQFAFSSSVSPAVMNRLNWTGENKNKFNVTAGVFYNFSTKH